MTMGEEVFLATVIRMARKVFAKNHFKGYLSHSQTSKFFMLLLDSVTSWTKILWEAIIFDTEQNFGNLGPISESHQSEIKKLKLFLKFNQMVITFSHFWIFYLRIRSESSHSVIQTLSYKNIRSLKILCEPSIWENREILFHTLFCWILFSQ